MTNDVPAPPGPDLSRVNVVLRIEAGRIDLTLGAIDTLTTGALIPLPGQPGRVDLIAHETVVGSGRLVTVDDAPAVEILTLAPTRERPAHGAPSRGIDVVDRPPGLSRCTGTTRP
ncbi:FliM/FliN family flagellar motor switch protein [Robbsia sp. Bb-Pol-6]|uniref:FliM/FliN family flagellar motor switch protein n=1 Tax=Robbsia betulipollinis TaxID=2981849 RepID=A0ABT3ZT74_9BURK|nr:FliM/FliN family flagellar motor switch protein [Robbsia betulipollinis]MCY0389754.1 FliM/FliN family flagellar motor switch protein [Robbsia betulipollinis]